MKWFETIKHGFSDPLGSCQAIKHKNYCFAPGSKFELCTKSTLPASLCIVDLFEIHRELEVCFWNSIISLATPMDSSDLKLFEL